MALVRKNFYLTEEQHAFLLSLEGTVSENIRRAIDEYISKKKNQNASPSLSKIMEGGKNG